MDRLKQPDTARILIFTSPKAGSGVGREQVPRLETLLCELGLRCRLFTKLISFGGWWLKEIQEVVRRSWLLRGVTEPFLWPVLPCF